VSNVVLLDINYPWGWRDYFVFTTFWFCRFPCTSYNKCLCCSFRIVVLLIVKYLNFFVGDAIILVFLHFDVVYFLVLPIVSTCTAPIEWLYFSALSIWSSSRIISSPMMGSFYFSYIWFLLGFLYFIYIVGVLLV
jgi:hypothetical protein